MRRRQSVLVTVIPVDVESVDTIHAFQFFKSIQRDLAGSGNKLKKLGALFLVK